jgi:hypothetical protein
MPLHPALKLLQDGKAPFVWRQWNTWPPWLKTVVLALLGLLVIDMLRLLKRKIESEKKIEYAKIEKQLVEYETEIDSKTHNEIAKELSDWDAKMRDLRREIHASRDITQSQRESFMTRYRALEFEIESSPNWVAKAAKVQDHGKTATTAKPSATPGPPTG